MKKKIMTAALGMAKHVIEHDELVSTIPVQVFASWTEQIEEWEKDSTKPNPFDEISEGPSQAAVRRQLAEDEARDITQGRDFALDDKVSPVILISSGIDLEAEQRVLSREAKKLWEHAQDRQKSKLQFRSNALQRKIDAWVKFQVLYYPGVEQLRTNLINESNRHVDLKPYEYPLWLPSQIKNRVQVPDLLRRIEWKLRYAQVHETLQELTHQLQVHAYLFKFKDRFVRGQGANTRARNAISGVQFRMDCAAEEYRNVFNALQSLAPTLLEFGWKDELLPLKTEDIRDLSEGKGGESEGKRTISWIWRTFTTRVDSESNDKYLLDRVRVEFAKSRARCNRFIEEVELASMEMGRILRFFAYKSQEWLTRGETTTWPAMTGSQAEAHRAYAHRQSSMYSALRTHCATLWKDVPAYIKRMQDIIEDPQLAAPGEFDRSASCWTLNSRKPVVVDEEGAIVVDEEVIVVDGGDSMVVDENV